METKPLAFGVVGFLIGGLIVSIAATQLNKDDTTGGSGMTMNQMSDDLRNKTGDDFDKAFLTSMIEHHQGAVDMATIAQGNAKHSEIKTMAEAIITTQSQEIEKMQAWQGEWGYTTTSNSHDTMGR